MSDTPRTDAFERQYLHHKPNYLAFEIFVPFARKLERELAEAREQLEDFEVEATNAINDIVRVKYQRDTLAEACRALLQSEEVQKVWPLDGKRKAEKPKDTHSSATVTVKFRRLLAINAALASMKGGSDD